MHTLDRISVVVGTTANVGLGLLFAASLGANAALTYASRERWLPELAVGVAVCGLALFRDRNRTGAAAVGLLVCGVAAVLAQVGVLHAQPSPAAALGLAVLGAACVRVAAPLPAALVALAGIAVLVAGHLTGGRYDLVALAFLVPLWCAALSVGLWLRFVDARRQAAVEAARRHERLELARELHDVVAHHVAGIVLQAQAGRLVPASRPAALEDTLAGIESAGAQALAAMRRVVGLLRDDDDGGPLAPAPETLGELVRRFARHGHDVSLNLPAEGPPTWPPEVTTTVYRIVQEALTNVVRHAPSARQVTVAVGDDRSKVTVEVTDDAPTSPSWLAPGGYGLVGMRERAEALGGTLSAGPRPGGGWVVRATVPLPPRGAM